MFDHPAVQHGARPCPDPAKTMADPERADNRGCRPICVAEQQGQADATNTGSPRMLEIAVRFALSFLSNVVYAISILLVVPMFLAGSETWMDWVKDAFAVTFIMDLDKMVAIVT